MLKPGFTVALFTFQFEVEAEEFFSELKIEESELDKIMIAGKSLDIYLQLTLLGPMEFSIIMHTINAIVYIVPTVYVLLPLFQI